MDQQKGKLEKEVACVLDQRYNTQKQMSWKRAVWTPKAVLSARGIQKIYLPNRFN